VSGLIHISQSNFTHFSSPIPSSAIAIGDSHELFFENVNFTFFFHVSVISCPESALRNQFWIFHCFLSSILSSFPLIVSEFDSFYAEGLSVVSSSGSSAIQISNQSTVFRSLSFDCVSINESLLSGLRNGMIENSVFRRTKSLYQGAESLCFQNCTFVGAVEFIESGVWADLPLTFSECVFEFLSIGIDLEVNASIFACKFVGCGIGIEIEGDGSFSILNTVFENYTEFGISSMNSTISLFGCAFCGSVALAIHSNGFLALRNCCFDTIGEMIEGIIVTLSDCCFAADEEIAVSSELMIDVPLGTFGCNHSCDFTSIEEIVYPVCQGSTPTPLFPSPFVISSASYSIASDSESPADFSTTLEAFGNPALVYGVTVGLCVLLNIVAVGTLACWRVYKLRGHTNHTFEEPTPSDAIRLMAFEHDENTPQYPDEPPSIF
jgi:hypothetical protein